MYANWNIPANTKVCAVDVVRRKVVAWPSQNPCVLLLASTRKCLPATTKTTSPKVMAHATVGYCFTGNPENEGEIRHACGPASLSGILSCPEPEEACWSR
jgi:hypothetical protein